MKTIRPQRWAFMPSTTPLTRRKEARRLTVMVYSNSERGMSLFCSVSCGCSRVLSGRGQRWSGVMGRTRCRRFSSRSRHWKLRCQRSFDAVALSPKTGSQSPLRMRGRLCGLRSAGSCLLLMILRRLRALRWLRGWSSMLMLNWRLERRGCVRRRRRYYARLPH